MRRENNNNCGKTRGCDHRDRIEVYAPHGTTFEVKYQVRDRGDNLAVLKKKVRIQDTKPPVVFLKDDVDGGLDKTKVSIECTSPSSCGVEGGTTWQDPGARAEDALDDDATLSKRVTGTCTNCKELFALKVSKKRDTIDTNAKAFTKYELSYEVADDAGNAAVPVKRTVEIRDSTKPVITMGAATKGVTHEAATLFTVDEGVAASDTLDGDYAMLPRHASRVRSVVARADGTCVAGQWFDAASRGTKENGPGGECKWLTPACKADQFEASSPGPTTDRACAFLSPKCGAGPELAAPTVTSDRVCHACPGNTSLLLDAIAQAPKPAAPTAGDVEVAWGLDAWMQDEVQVKTGKSVAWVWTQQGVSYGLAGGTAFTANGTTGGTGGKNPSWEKRLKTIGTKRADATATTFTHRFTTAGVYPYHSFAFPSMSGVVTVTDPGQRTLKVVWGRPKTPPWVLVVTEGDTVTWVWERNSLPSILRLERADADPFTLVTPGRDGTFYHRAFTKAGRFVFSSDDVTEDFLQKVTVVVKARGAFALNRAVLQPKLAVQALAGDGGLCHDVSADQLAQALVGYAGELNAAAPEFEKKATALYDCGREDEGETKYGLAIYNTLEARVRQRAGLLRKDVEDTLDGWFGGGSLGDDTRDRIQHLKNINVGVDPKPMLARIQSTLTLLILQLDTGAGGLEYSKDSGSTWEPLRFGKPEDGVIIATGLAIPTTTPKPKGAAAAAAAAAAGVRVRVSPGRAFQGHHHLFTFRLWPVFTRFAKRARVLYVSWAAQFHPNGTQWHRGQFVCVRAAARTPHGGVRFAQVRWRNEETYPPGTTLLLSLSRLHVQGRV